MNKDELVKVLLGKPGYIKSGPNKVKRQFNVTKAIAIEAIREAYKIRNAPSPKNIKRLFFDIETSPNLVYSYRVGNKVFLTPDMILEERKIICISYKWEHEKDVHCITWDENQDDKTLLEIFSQILMESDEAIAHNGDRYDIPFIRTRCLFHRIPMLPDVKTLDTYKKTKRFSFNSNKLDYLGKFLVNEQKLSTGGFDLWKRVCYDKSQEALQEMVNYCNQDVLLLEKVYHELENYIKPNTHVGVLTDENAASCPGCGSIEYNYIKMITTPAGAVNHQLQCKCCNKFYKVNKTNFKKLENGNV